MLDVGTLFVGWMVDLSVDRLYLHDDHDSCLFGILSQERRLLRHGEIRSDGRFEKRDWRSERADRPAQENRRMK